MNINDTLTLYDLFNYMSLANTEISKLIKSRKLFQDREKIIPYSFSVSKLQKLFIIAMLKYFNKFSNDNPVVDFINVNVVNYGFSVDCHSAWMLHLDKYYDNTKHKDQNKSLYAYLNDNYTKADAINMIVDSEMLNTMLSKSFCIPRELRYTIIDTMLEFGLYKPKTLGILLNVLKNSSYIPPAAQTVSIQDLYLATKSIPSDENVLMEFITKRKVI